MAFFQDSLGNPASER